MLSTRQRLEYNVIDPAPHERHVDAHCLQVLAEGRERPLEAEVIMLSRFVLNEVVVLFVYRVVC